ncbi:phage tail assembly chaperone [Pseudomonas sp. O230]|uniref:phage tail assembly chaperone n=1 Tax=Pseudomonas sp. O230 TaxID=3159450 RepID=UPI00387B65CE
MKYFHNPQTDEVNAYEDDAPAHFISAGLVPLSEAEVQAYIHSATAPTTTKADDERKWRDAKLISVMWLRERHRDQLEIAGPATLSTEQFSELLVYMQALRDWPQSPDFPDNQHRPVAPSWIAEQTR